MWAILARHLSTQPLRTLRIKLKWSKNNLLPISLTRPETSHQSALSFDILRNRLTHLEIEVDYPNTAFAIEANFSDLERLKFLESIYILTVLSKENDSIVYRGCCKVFK